MESNIKLIKYSQNIDNISIVSKDRLDNGKGLDNPSLNTVSTHLNLKLSSDYRDAILPAFSGFPDFSSVQSENKMISFTLLPSKVKIRKCPSYFSGFVITLEWHL